MNKLLIMLITVCFFSCSAPPPPSTNTNSTCAFSLPENNTDVCNICIVNQCCEEFTTCFNDTHCTKCKSIPQEQSCETDSNWNNLLNCVTKYCAVDCVDYP